MVEPEWQCPHLTSLRLVHVPHIGVDDTSGAKCTGLRQLQLERCSLDEWAISSHLCTTLCQLSSLQILDSEPFRVPPQFSALRWGRVGAVGCGQRLPVAVGLCLCIACHLQWGRTPPAGKHKQQLRTVQRTFCAWHLLLCLRFTLRCHG